MAKRKKTISVQEKFQTIRDTLNNKFFERTEEIDGLLTALVAGEHILLLGPPGTAKTAVTEELANTVKGSRYFSYLLSKFTTPEELFGPFSLKGLKEDKYKRVVNSKLPEAEIAFLDEIFKANSSILNSLLTLINERVFNNNGTMNCPLVTLVGASNEMPEGEELGALYDRFLLRYWVDYIKDASSFKSMLFADECKNKLDRIGIGDIEEAFNQAQTIDIPEHIQNLIVELKLVLEKNGFNSSDRRWKKALKLLKAYAWLNNGEEVNEEDLLILQHVLWNEPKDKVQLTKLLTQTVHPLIYAANEILDAAKEMYSKVSFSGHAEPEELAGMAKVATQLRKQSEKIKSLTNGKNSETAFTAISEINRMRERVLEHVSNIYSA